MAAGLRLERNDAHAQAVQSRHLSMTRAGPHPAIHEGAVRPEEPGGGLLVVGETRRVRGVDRPAELLEAGSRVDRHGPQDRLTPIR